MRHLLPPFCLALALAAPPLHAAPHPSLPNPGTLDGLGVNIHFTDPSKGEMEMLAAAGFRWVRMDLGWENIERERGKYDFSAIDRLVSQLERFKIKALFILDYSHRLYEQDNSVRTDEGRSAFARWAAATAKRYEGRGFLWEVWNEPNISFWKPTPDAAVYSALAHAAAAQIHKTSPGEAVIGPACSGIDVPFLDGCFKMGVLEDFAGVSLHPYRQSDPETVLPEYAKLRNSIQQAAPANSTIPLISGEWGYSAAWDGFDEDRQGRMLARGFLTNLSQGIALSIWYDWRDDGSNPKDAEHHFGSVGLPRNVEGGGAVFRIKPAYRAAHTLTTTLQGMHFIKRLALGTTNDWVLLFGKDHEMAAACWTTANDARTIRLPVGNAKLRLHDHLGTDITPPAGTEGSIEVALDGAPRYLSLDRIVALLLEVPSPPAFTCEMIRGPDGGFLALLENPGGDPFSGSLRLTGIGGTRAVPISLTQGETSKVVRLETPAEATTSAVGLEVWIGEHRIMIVPARQFLLADPQLLARCLAKSDGDSKVASAQTIALAANPPPLPGFATPAWELTCRFEPGWRFATFEPQGNRDVPGQPKSFGLWVFGDDSGIALRMRLRDAAGRTWQPDGGNVNWRGWHHVRFEISPTTAHWGGSGEPIVRYPLQWEVPVLLDNTSRKSLQSRILVTAPTIQE